MADAAELASGTWADSHLHGLKNLPNRGATKPLKLVRTERGCLVPISHKPNPNGYVAIVATRFGLPGKDLLHRIAYKITNGPDSIPEGYEIDHLCHNRACCEPSHLQAIRADEHRYLTAMTRWDGLKERLAVLWCTYGPRWLVKEYGDAIGIGPDPAGRWLKEIKREIAEDQERWGGRKCD